MLELIGQNRPLAYASAPAIVSACLCEMRFPEKVPPSVAARRHRVLSNPGGYSGKWGDGPYFVRHLDRIMDCLGGGAVFAEVGLMGPSQVGKSEVGNNWQMQAVLYDPTDMLFIAPDRVLIEAYVKKEFNKMVDLTTAWEERDAKGEVVKSVPSMAEKMLPGGSADTMSMKRFRGADLFFYWPTGPRLRALPFPRVRLDDYDDIPTDISDQGDAVALARGRMGSFAAFGRTKLYVNSSPKLGQGAGIEGFVAGGTDERLWVDCLSCGTPFEMCFENLQYERRGTKEDAAASAAMVCLECGGVHQAREKRPLLETFRWVGRGETAVPRGDSKSGKAGELERNVRASFRLDGVAGFRLWSEIARLGREAELAFEYEQDEGLWKTFDQTIVGRNYRQRREGGEQVTEDQLVKRAKASPYKMGEVPPEARVLIASLDQQGSRFEVAIWAFGENFKAWLVDRFAIMAVEEGGRLRPLRPFTRLEDWAVIHQQVMGLTYPLAGAPHLRMKLFNTIVDTGGLDNATDNAFAWWHSMVAGDAGSGRKKIPATAITLVKGGNKPGAKLLPPPTIDAKRQIKGAPQAELYVPNVNRIKDILDVRINRREEGPGWIGFPNDCPGVTPADGPNYLAEMRVEYKEGAYWMRPEHAANETWDLYVYAYTVILRFGGGDAKSVVGAGMGSAAKGRSAQARGPGGGAAAGGKSDARAATGRAAAKDRKNRGFAAQTEAANPGPAPALKVESYLGPLTKIELFDTPQSIGAARQ